ncbi:hypothetical protein EHQ92_00600 [Leptospira biflexa]|jgi:hypothetical protein|uniref:hypothetical protein n=1 Tax=Leptospira biflexa TaxID=172 RepID=UPI0010845282|nr:hypothetical protein [Leptospira biflexa]TGM31780.1 hypothetical protein EHQ89_15585 [Leptospira biflexa]TGM36922.1 hypothetical protein EHQ80_04790 [Leptospira biflexa]TGM46459.1 hypothetical protein EHQ92_00600 [Leptospira biflexa]TGM51080.1 hypothetical protein EHQ88_12485 [Leptospira biflexa]TGM56344.1 hypothetical protein EHQ91_15820 [Leptospira biflexa]
MKTNKNKFSLLLISVMIMSGFISCTKSSAKDGNDPTLLSLVVGGAQERIKCGSAVLLVNSCVGGQGTGQYVDAGAVCGGNSGYDNDDLVKCVSAKVAELDCTNPTNKFNSAAAALKIAIASATVDSVTTVTVTHSGAFGSCFLKNGAFVAAGYTLDETAGTATK